MQKKVLNYRIIIEKEKYEDGTPVYSAFCPTLGVADYGDTVDTVLTSIKDGIELMIETLAKDGEEIPVDNINNQIITSAQIELSPSLKVSFA